MLFWLILIAGTLCYIGLVLIVAACMSLNGRED